MESRNKLQKNKKSIRQYEIASFLAMTNHQSKNELFNQHKIKKKKL
jgi:hypothetical protein